MVQFSQLTSHRFRGFDVRENTLAGFTAALDFGVQNLEFDIRVTRCGTPVIYHDEFAPDGKGQNRLLVDVMADEFASLGGTFAHMPTADALFEAAAGHSNNAAKLLVDIKDAGFEVEIDALIRAHGLQNRAVYVSWLPQVLYRMAELAPDIPLCLSHWPESPSDKVRAHHHVFTARDGRIPHPKRKYVHGERLGWYVKGGLRGDLRTLIRQSGGSVCLPINMLTKENIVQYQEGGIKVSAFSFIAKPTIERFETAYGLDTYFIDNKTVFDEFKAQAK